MDRKELFSNDRDGVRLRKLLQHAKSKNTKSLDLSGRLISVLPAELGQLTNLERLDLGPGNNKFVGYLSSIGQPGYGPSNNLIADLPQEIGDLQSLKYLRLSDNQLTSLPKRIGDLTKLTVLDLSNNKLLFLPDEIGNLSNLQELNLEHNNLRSLPGGLKSLGNLEKLKLSGNELPIPPETLRKTRDPQTILKYYFSILALNKTNTSIENEAQNSERNRNITQVYVGGNFDGNMVIGNQNVVGPKQKQVSLEDLESAHIQVELKEALKRLTKAVDDLNGSLPEQRAAGATKHLFRLIDEAEKPVPDQKQYSVSIDELIKAAENAGKVGEPVINLSTKVLSLLMGG